MKTFLIVFLILCGNLFGASARKPEIKKKIPVAKVEMAPQRTKQQDEELKSWIIGVQNQAKQAIQEADIAQKETENTKIALSAATESAISLQKTIDAQTNAYNQALLDKEKLSIENKKLEKKNGFLSNILGFEAAAIVLLILLWLKIPALIPGYGWAIVAAAPIGVFFLVKLIL